MTTLPTSSLRPALFDLQVNGFGGIDFQRSDLQAYELGRAVQALHRHGMHRIFLTLITDDIDAMARKLERLEKIRAEHPAIAETICGYHLEGPYLSPKPGFCGAHPPDRMKAPDAGEFQQLQEAAGGNVRIVTIAPEWGGSDEFIAELVRQKVMVSLGHTDASEADIDRAIAAGANLCTHLGNGCPTEMHRHNNIIQRLLARDELIACFIPDGIHVPPHALKNMFRAKPAGKVILTTDCMSAAGAPNGRYTIGDIEVEVGDDRVVRHPGRSTFAGSALTLEDGVGKFASWTGLPEREAWDLASTAVARLFHVELPLIEFPQPLIQAK
jgi:N-acetylglucosamine-6-phosphate deacetylase